MPDDSTNDDADDTGAGASYYAGSTGPDREGMANEFLPAREDWAAKTVLDLNDPARVAALYEMDKLFPEIAHQQPVINNFLQNYLKSRTSVGGQSRHQFVDILMSMFGGARDEDNAGEMLQEALAAGLDDEE